VDLTKERQQVMLAKAKHLNVFDDDHFVIRDIEQRALKDFVSILLLAPGQEFERLLHALRRADKAIAVRILPQPQQ